ncbi:3'-N-debenzoyl-2'-deoxytaxol N-benzoyltransferase-like [Coffea eugenioides]|uniref:3'-N-debenzoyl-2'-deoxytaxol N-benzoyltransferase-like n=1 Tax=Coffea eugenioides TaxID=49369 RepID=UPI000F610482|nr:3'-N-debenzoyl-2'-deoxytaxol N-benzoyltransferase-like [Coffea eugenioides]
MLIVQPALMYTSFIIWESCITQLFHFGLGKDEWTVDKSHFSTSYGNILICSITVSRVKASGIPSDEKVKFAYAINIRKLVKPPLPAGYWGILTKAEDHVDQPIYKTAELINKSKYNVSDEYVRSFIDFQELNYHEGTTVGAKVSGITDWRHLGHPQWTLVGEVLLQFFLCQETCLEALSPVSFCPILQQMKGKRMVVNFLCVCKNMLFQVSKKT